MLRVFGWSQVGLEPTILCTRGEQVNHYTINVVQEWNDINDKKLYLTNEKYKYTY
jgi:hypothetical protein